MNKQQNIIVTAIICFIILSMGAGNFLNGEKKIELIEVAVSDQLWTGVAVSHEGRIFVNYPRWSPNVKLSVAEVTGKKRSSLFPMTNGIDGTGILRLRIIWCVFRVSLLIIKMTCGSWMPVIHFCREF